MITVQARHRTRPAPWRKARALGKTFGVLLLAVTAFSVFALAALVTSIGMLFGIAGAVSGLL